MDNTLEQKSELKAYVYDVIGCCQLVHRELGPYLNEYIYQEALALAFSKKGIEFVKEYQFNITFLGQVLSHKHIMDFFIKNNICLECKAVQKICDEHRQQLFNYMRLSHTPIGILYNFAPAKDQCEKYYLDEIQQAIITF